MGHGESFAEHAVGARGEGLLEHRFFVSHGAHDNDGQFGAGGFHAADEVEAVVFAEENIDDCEVDDLLPENAQRFRRPARGADGKAMMFEEELVEVANCYFVFDQENSSVHQSCGAKQTRLGLAIQEISDGVRPDVLQAGSAWEECWIISRDSRAGGVKRGKGLMKFWIIGLVLAATVAGVELKAQPGERPWFSLDFKGGTPEELATTMRKEFEKTMTEPPAINVVIPDDLAKTQVPAMQMRKVDAGAVFEALNGIWRKEGLQWVRAGENVWVLHQVPDRRKTRAFYVGDLLRKFKVNDITTAVKTTWEFGGAEKALKPELKYHQETNMLIALAEAPDLDTVTEVLAQLRMALAADAPAVPAPAR